MLLYLIFLHMLNSKEVLIENEQLQLKSSNVQKLEEIITKLKNESKLNTTERQEHEKIQAELKEKIDKLVTEKKNLACLKNAEELKKNKTKEQEQEFVILAQVASEASIILEKIPRQLDTKGLDGEDANKL